MHKRFHWGHGIAVFYIIFVGAVITALIRSFSVDHSLVVDDYYATDLAYQTRYDQHQNSLKTPLLTIKTDANDQQTRIIIDSDRPIVGSVHWYRPSDQKADFVRPLSGRDTKISTSKLLKGRWVLKVLWTIGGKTSYQEEEIFIS